MMGEEEQGKSKAKRVWILGAGFSRPLGGPLLADLFTMRGWRKAHDVFSEQFDQGRMDSNKALLYAVYIVFHWGTGLRDGTLFGFKTLGTGEKLFQHAEDFMVQIERPDTDVYGLFERACTSEIAFDHYTKGVHNSVVEKVWSLLREHSSVSFKAALVVATKRLMAFECSVFHEELIRVYPSKDEVGEPYIPYQDWGKVLVSGEDILITFNYDLVVETVVDRPDVDLLKLHGSVHTSTMAGGVKVTANKPYAILSEQEHVPDIKTPGRSKAQMTPADNALWEKAGAYIEQAEEVIFLGYGLPESDAYARKFLLQHLIRNDISRLRIGIVLGEPNFRTQRLAATLRQALGHREHSQEVRTRHRQDLHAAELAVTSLTAELETARTGRGSTMVSSSGASWNVRDESELLALLGVEEENHRRLEDDFKDMTLTVLPQYAQDYMQGFATSQGSKLK